MATDHGRCAPAVGMPARRAGRCARSRRTSDRASGSQLRGAGGLSSAELIALVWGSGSAQLNARGAGRGGAGPPRRPERPRPGHAASSSRRSPGVGPARAAQLEAAFELGRRLLADWPSGRWQIRSPRDVADRLVLQMGRLEREELRVVLLNTKNVVLRVVTVYQGNVSVQPGPGRRAVPRRRPANATGSSSSTTTRRATRRRPRTTCT